MQSSRIISYQFKTRIDMLVEFRDVVSGYLDIQAILAIHYPDTKKVEISNSVSSVVEI